MWVCGKDLILFFLELQIRKLKIFLFLSIALQYRGVMIKNIQDFKLKGTVKE